MMNPPQIDWAIPHVLARAARPGYPADDVLPDEVQTWIARAKSHAVRTIICFLTDQELGAYYGAHKIQLLQQYQRVGFNVVRIPAEDHVYPPLKAVALAQLVEAVQQTPAPWLLHCSAGIDRTGMAIDHVIDRLRAASGSMP